MRFAAEAGDDGAARSRSKAAFLFILPRGCGSTRSLGSSDCGRSRPLVGACRACAPPAELALALERDFGSVMAWRAEFTAMAKALAGGSGWVILAWSERLGRLVNQWAADHAHGLQGATPILALDMYEHAYHLDFGAKAAAYVDQLMTT